ncbi:Na+/H+ antiporter subunit E [Haloglomus litoreum]|uniref:Na+/H+ antiporter subunit E n=1 Tax=Haloglomus litoreum TaxID=3034026 RepID=UPI0023E8A38B|nr:Na+/H+ antiporter subunit E [Haloglomus sp. DT116]
MSAVPERPVVLVGEEDAAAATTAALRDLRGGGATAAVLVAPTPDAADAAADAARDSPLSVDLVVATPDALPTGDGRVLAAPDVEGAPAAAERVPVPRAVRHRPLVHDGGAARFVGVFALSFGFYLLLGDPTDPFDLVTGAVTATLAGVLLSPIVFETPPAAGRTLPRAARATVFLPYLLFEVLRANLSVARVILDPSLPIEPSMVEVPHDARSGLERAVLANAVTLTPGTLTVDVDERRLRVHALTSASRTDLQAGALARAVAFVFHGRGGPDGASAGGDERRDEGVVR